MRPEPDASKTVNRAREIGLDALAVPLFRVEPVPWDAPDPAEFDSLLLTSANAVRQAGDKLPGLRGLKAYCVGAATAEAARRAGFDIASIGEAGVERLLGSIEAGHRLLHLAGEHRTQIAHVRQSITTVIVYRSSTVDNPGLRDAEGNVVALHSQRAARRVADLTAGFSLDRSRISLAAISEAVAAAAGAGWQSCAAAERIDDSSLLALAKTMCDKPA